MMLSRVMKDRAFRHWLLVWLRHRRRPRYTAGTLSAFGYQLDVADHISVVHQFLDIFVNHEYRLPPLGPRPVVVDVGANVGVSVLYFCRHLDDPEIHAFEPDPSIYAKLKRNVERYAPGMRVHLLNGAAHTSNMPLRFESEGADGGHVVAADAGAGTVEVQGIDLLEYLQQFQHVDLLKIDIEGAEAEVVPHCAPALARVDRVFIEYHSSPGREQRLPQILALLQQAGFRMHLQTAGTHASPFVPVLAAPFDNQVNIFAYRPS
jgi:FkbM family methyltransferase